MSHNWGYKEAAKMSSQMGMVKAAPLKISVKAHVRSPRTPPAPVTASRKYAEGAAVGNMSDREKAKASVGTGNMSDREKAKSGSARGNMSDKESGYAKGGAVKKNWIADATKNKGGLHKSLGIAADQKIPAKKLQAAASKSGKVGKQARLAETLKSFRK